MKTKESIKWSVSVVGLALIVTAAGCRTDSNTQHFPSKYRATDGRAIDVGNRMPADNGWKFDEPHLDKCWATSNFDFTGYDTLYIAPTLSTAKLHSSDEESTQTLAKENLVLEFQRFIRAKHIMDNVVTREPDIPPGAHVLKMQNTIIQYAKGSEAVRFWIPAGQPKLRVSGKITDGEKTVFEFEGYRSGTSAAALFNGGYMTDVDIQLGDIRSLTTDVTDVMAVVAGKYKPRN
jgi:hypothetical protein